MKKRFITSIAIVAVTALAILSKLLPHNIGEYIFDIFVVAVSIVSGFEIANMFEKLHKFINKFLTSMYAIFNYICFLVLMRNAQFSLIIGAQVLLLVAYFVIAIIVESIKNRTRTPKENLISALNTIVGCIYPTFWLMMLVEINHIDYFVGVQYFSLVFIILIQVIAWCTDTMAYLVGSRLKGPKLAPSISPNKTISGGIGGLVGGVVGALLVYCLVANIPALNGVSSIVGFQWWHFLLIGLVASVLGQAGDLFESKLKRNANLKDSGDIFPGHGGMLDRIDALIFITIFVFLILESMLI